MPEAVLAYSRRRSLRDGLEVQREICDSLRQDFARYAPRSDPYCLDAVFAGVALRAGQQVKYTRLAEGWSIPTIKRALGLLTKARIARRIPAASPAGLPLGATASPRKFKALLLDVGLLQHLRGVPPEVEHRRSDLLALHEGAVAEQYVGQELLVSQGTELHYWARQARGSSAEVDYLVTIEGRVVPVEVKRGPAGRLRSLHMLLEAYPSCPRGLVFSSARYAELPGITFVPLYHAFSATCRGP